MNEGTGGVPFESEGVRGYMKINRRLLSTMVLAVVLALVLPATAGAATSKSSDLGAYASAMRGDWEGGDYVTCDVFVGAFKVHFNEPGLGPIIFDDEQLGVYVQEYATQGTQDVADDTLRFTAGYLDGFDSGIDKKLLGASGTAILDAFAEEYLATDLMDPEMPEWPVPIATYEDTIDVDMTWVGTGALVAEKTSSKIRTESGRAIEHGAWVYRMADVAGSVTVGDGRLVFDSDEFSGQMYSSRFGSVVFGEPWPMY